MSQGTFHGPVIGVQNNYSHAPTGSAPADGWPEFGEFRRLALGVRPAHRSGDEPVLPPYVPRDCDAQLDRLFARGLHNGGLIVVTGEPLSGRTSTAWAVLNRAVSKDIRLFQAPPGADLSGLPAALGGRDSKRTYVVWLDDLEGHLGEQGLTAALLAQLTQPGVLVLATMRDEAYDAYRFGDHDNDRVLSGACAVELSCRWSETELSRLEQTGDPLLQEAVRRRGELGVTQFLALGPELWEEWRRARRSAGQPGGYLLVRAAVDAARCGLTRALPLSVWEYIQGEHLEWDELSPEGEVEDDLAWAVKPRFGVAGLLVPGEEKDTWRANGALVANASLSTDMPLSDAHLWLVLADVAKQHSPAEFDDVVRAGRAAVRTSDEPDLYVLATLAGWAGDDADAKHWYRSLVERNPRMGMGFAEYLADRGEYIEAIRQLETAALAGSIAAKSELGFLLLSRAEHWLATAVEAGAKRAAPALSALRKAGLGSQLPSKSDQPAPPSAPQLRRP
ncbi:sel1 repeat family protein [Streptomyces sp. ISL-22]|uniref:sel1 repeat family protein n=1 Tax=unclassified Streptomyces TaxID=2593676 RepID=UPI001BE713B9|nr:MULTISPECIES: sel1 repeat family protein [unclassified Streptomyces]MBT2419785.1 sel1 repeat family protein [Streptomyces sp. ISL-24]MBT2431779.1 sel1 repeat family protein [Streptomyces sp. ISL-22]